MAETKTPQRQLVVDYMNKYGSITPLQAMRDLGIYRLASRIADLRKRDYIIIDEWVEVETKYGGTTRVKRYRLACEDDFN